MDFSTELAAARQAASWGVPTPPVLAHGCLQDKYRFYYIATQYSPGKEAGPWLRDATPAQQAAFVERLRQLLPRLHRPTQALPRRDLRQEARGNFRLEKLAPSLREEVLARLEGLPLEPVVLTHGDLTGENLLVQEDGSFVVIDWAAVAAAGRRGGGAFCGAPAGLPVPPRLRPGFPHQPSPPPGPGGVSKPGGGCGVPPLSIRARGRRLCRRKTHVRAVGG